MRFFLRPLNTRLVPLWLTSTYLTGLCLMSCLISPLLPHAHAETFAVVDTARILTESDPAKAGEAHMQKVQAVLQKALDDLQAVYKGKENTPAAQKALREGYLALEQHLTREKQGVLQVLHAAMEKSVKSWRSKNKKYHAVINKQMLLDSDLTMDVTSAILQEMEKQSVTFAELPAVRINPPTNAAATSAKPTAKQPAQAVKQPGEQAVKPAGKQPPPKAATKPAAKQPTAQ